MVQASTRTSREQLASVLTRVADGDPRALRDLYRSTSAKLFGVCLRICQDREAAEDILQQVYIKVWDRAGRFDAERSSPVTWLCAIARNASIDWLRANRSEAHLPESAALAVADDAPLASHSIAAEQDRAQIFRCLDALDERPRKAIHAAFFDGLTYLQLSEVMAVPLGTLKSWVRRGLIQLKVCLSHE